jgi:hypothetical protein
MRWWGIQQWMVVAVVLLVGGYAFLTQSQDYGSGTPMVIAAPPAAGGVAGMTQIITGANDVALPTVGVTHYTSLMGPGKHGPYTTEAQAVGIVASAGTMRGLRVQLRTANDADEAYTFSLRLEDGGGTMQTTGLACQVGNSSSTCSNDTPVTIAAGRKVSLMIVADEQTNEAAANAKWSVKFISDGGNESVLMGTNQFDADGPVYGPLHGANNAGETDIKDSATLIPTAGTIKNLYVKSSDVQAGAERVYEVLHNGASASPTMTCTITGEGGTTDNCSDLGAGFTVAAGDLIVLSYDDTATHVSHWVAAGVAFVADTTGYFIIASSTDDVVKSEGTIEKLQIAAGDSTANTNQAYVRTNLNAFTVVNWYVDIDTAPGVGETWDVSLWNEGASTDFTCQMANTTACADTSGTLAPVDDDLMHFQTVSSATAADCGGMRTAITGNVP